MKLKLTCLLTLFMAFAIQISFAQEKSVSGTITAATDGLPLPGVNVIVKGTTRGVQSDFDGNYTINASLNETLVFSFVGLRTVEKKIGTSNTINLQMEEDAAALEEVVVVGYTGATNSSKIASSLSTVSAESIDQVPIASIDQLLQGQAAGVNVSTGSGQPGQSATIIIRGRNSLNGDFEPLFILDGVPVSQDNFRSLNQNDIESMSVLKDAAATAIYGNRGAGGVILITTKTGKRGSGIKLQVRSLYGVSFKPKTRFDVMNASQFLTFQQQNGIGYGASLSDEAIATVAAQSNTNWSDIFFRKGQTTSQEVTITTGGERSTSFSSLQFYRQEGITLGSELQRFSLRNNFSTSSENDKFRFTSNISLNRSVSNFVVDAARGGNTGGQLDNPFIVPYIGLPYLSPFNPDGSINIVGTGPTNTGGSGAYNANGTINANGANGFQNTPFIALNTAAKNTDQEAEIKIVGRVAADYNFIENFTVGTSVGVDYTYEESLAIIDPTSIRALLTPSIGSLLKGSQGEGFYREANIITNAYLRYENDITEKLNLSAAVYGEYNYTNLQNAGFTAFGLNPALPTSGAGFTDGNTTEGEDNDIYNYIPNVFSGESEIALASVFGTLDLDYDGKYGFSGSVRNDATSRFVKNRSGVFYSVAGRWNIDKEEFMASADWINTLKFRISYGVVGNQDLGAGSRYIGQQTVLSTTGYQLQPAYSLGALIDPNIKWETSKQFNIGMSYGLWKNRFSGELDYYVNKTTDLFANQLLSVAGTGANSVQTNVADMTNTGIDVQFSYDLLRRSQSNPWNIKINANGNWNKNEVGSIPGGFTGNTLRIAEGRPAFTWFLPRWAGVDPASGQALYLDLDGNITNVFSPANAVYLDKNFDPTYTGGFGTDISYKGFTLSSLFAFQADRWKINNSLAIIEDVGLAGFANQSTTILDAWTTPGQITSIPAVSQGGLRARSGDRYLEDASFLRLRNVSLSYNMDSKVLESMNTFTGVRLYVQGTNLFTWTKFRGFDPEGTLSSSFFDYPVPRTVTMGVDLTF